jgi:ATP-dependent Clp protease ATP-binding subunit ClpC
MFESFTEKARRIIFFARYEASQLGSGHIEPEHLLLGLLREDETISEKFIGPFREVEPLRKQIADRAHRSESASTSINLPLSEASNSVLDRANKERLRLGGAKLDSEHLLLGLLQRESLASEILLEKGVRAELVREEIENPIPFPLPSRRESTACKDCRNLIVDGELDPLRFNLYCAASPTEPAFDCYTGEFRCPPGNRLEDRYRACVMVNFGTCSQFNIKVDLS